MTVSVKVHPDAAGARKSSGKHSIGRSKVGSQQKYSVYASAKFAMIFRLSAGNKYPISRK